MKNLDFEWLTDEFMLYCRSTQLREKTMSGYEQTLRLFERWYLEQLDIRTVDIGIISNTQKPFTVKPAIPQNKHFLLNEPVNGEAYGILTKYKLTEKGVRSKSYTLFLIFLSMLGCMANPFYHNPKDPLFGGFRKATI